MVALTIDTADGAVTRSGRRDRTAARSYAHGVLVGRTGLSPVMVGRAAELDRLVGLVGARHAPMVALVAGEAGIRKTRLVQELVRRVPAGTLVLAGQADPGTVGRPMELFLDATAPAVTAPAGAPGREDGAGDAGRHGRGGGEHDGDGGPDGLLAVVRDADRPADERVRAGVGLVRRLARDRTALVVFEDLHWADSESVAVFERLAEPAPAGEDDPSGLVLVGTYRPDGLSRRHPTAEALPRIERRHSVTHVHLDRLSPAEVSSFLAAVYEEEPSFRMVDALHTRTGGNPFFLEELVASSGDRAPRDDVDAPLPWTVSELVRSELDDLDPDVRELVSAAAVLGRRFTFDLLAAVTGAAEGDLIARLRVAVDRGLLVEGDPDVFGFHHELAREAVESGLLGRERRRLHEAALDALRAAGSRDHVALVDHARGAGRFDDMVAEARLGARESLALGSSYQALQLAEAGLAEVPDDDELLSIAARAAWLAGLLDDSQAHAERWLALARAADDVDHEAAALAVRTRVAYERGDLDAVARHTEALISVVDRLPTDEARARAMAAVAQSYMLREQAEATYEWADKALALAEARGLDRVRLAAMVEKGSMLLMDPARTDEARELLEAAADEAERTGEHVLAARTLNNLVWHARQWSDVGQVRSLIERMRVQARAAGFDSLAVTDVAASLAHLAAVEGDLDGAIAQLDEAQRVRDGHTGWIRSDWTAVFRAGLALEAGDLDGAERFTEKARPATARTAVAVIGLDLHIACRRGDLARARALLADLIVACDAEGYTSASQAHDLLSAALAAGLGADEVRPLVERVGHYVGHRLDPDHPWRRMLGAQLAEAEGAVDDAIAGYEAAAETLGAAPEILAGHRGTAHVGAAANLVRAGRLDEARVHAAEAARHLARWRGWRVEQLRAVERRLGIGDEVAGPESLTPREREVAGLLAEGLTNSQLAERLYISPRTAAVHVSNLLSKLGMGSRTEVAAWAVRSGLAEG
jgi:DNA-binding CsgD family transcriptional regulator